MEEQSNRNEKTGALVELFKYPVTVFSVLVALVFAKLLLGITFGSVSEVGPDGVKFSQDQKAEVADLSSKLNGALASIEALQGQVGKLQPTDDSVASQNQATIFEASQSVSDQAAQLSRFDTLQGTGSQKQNGYIWIGDYKNGRWSRGVLGSVADGQPFSSSPDKLVSGSEFRILRKNLVARDGMPTNDSVYFRDRRILGVLPIGTKIRLMGPPKVIERKFATQYWAEFVIP